MIDIDPNSSGLPGIEQLRTIVGAVMTVGLILSVLALIVSAIVWAYGANSSNPHLSGRGKLGVLISCGAAYTAPSSAVCHRKAGGAALVVFSSADIRCSRPDDGEVPNRLSILP